MKSLFQKSTGTKQAASLASPRIQPKLMINQPGDRYEREADAMADQVMRMPQSKANIRPSTGLIARSIQRKCADCEKEEKKPRAKGMLQRKADTGGGMAASPTLVAQLNATKGAGAPLPAGTRQFMEQGFGADFSGVRVHTDTRAAEMSQSIQARAFTHGRDVYFSRGEYQPHSGEGKRLLAHELGHVVQQEGKDIIKRIEDKSRKSNQNTNGGYYTIQYHESIEKSLQIFLQKHFRIPPGIAEIYMKKIMTRPDLIKERLEEAEKHGKFRVDKTFIDEFRKEAKEAKQEYDQKTSLEQVGIIGVIKDIHDQGTLKYQHASLGDQKELVKTTDPRLVTDAAKEVEENNNSSQTGQKESLVGAAIFTSKESEAESKLVNLATFQLSELSISSQESFENDIWNKIRIGIQFYFEDLSPVTINSLRYMTQVFDFQVPSLDALRKSNIKNIPVKIDVGKIEGSLLKRGILKDGVEDGLITFKLFEDLRTAGQASVFFEIASDINPIGGVAGITSQVATKKLSKFARKRLEKFIKLKRRLRKNAKRKGQKQLRPENLDDKVIDDNVFVVDETINKELIKFWEEKIKETKDPFKILKFRRYLKNIKEGRKVAPKQSEMELEYLYSAGGVQPQVSSKSRYRVPYSTRGSSRSDLTLGQHDIEIKTFATLIDNDGKINKKALNNLIYKTRDELGKRIEQTTSGTNMSSQRLILDLRGHVIENNNIIREIVKAVSNRVGIPIQHIQVVI